MKQSLLGAIARVEAQRRLGAAVFNTLPDGTVLKLREWDYIWVNEDGKVTRWDWFVDPDKWEQLLGLVGLEPKGLTSQQYTVNFLRDLDLDPRQVLGDDVVAGLSGRRVGQGVRDERPADLRRQGDRACRRDPPA